MSSHVATPAAFPERQDPIVDFFFGLILAILGHSYSTVVGCLCTWILPQVFAGFITVLLGPEEYQAQKNT